MKIDKILDLITFIIGTVTKDQKEKLQTVIELVLANTQPVVVEQKTEVSVPNEIKNDVKENEISLIDTPFFKLPEEFQVQFEGEEGTKRIKILPDGISETYGKTEKKNTGQG